MKLRTAKIAGAIAWYLECPKCEGTVIDEDGGSVTHGFHTTGENLICMECGIADSHSLTRQGGGNRLPPTFTLR